MKGITVSTTFIADGSPLHEALDLCKKVGIQSIEIGSNHCYEKSYSYLFDYNFNYLIHNYFPIPKESFVLNIASFNSGIRLKSIEHIKKAIDFSIELGAKIYTFHPGFLTDPKGSNLTSKSLDFQWDEKQLEKTNHPKAKELMFDALDEIIKYAKSKNFQIAIETEGSVSKKNHLLMQKPKEYQELMLRYDAEEIGININIGHLNLASKAFNFNKFEFIDLIQDYIVAMELSHNDGLEDQHLPLQKGMWYWDLIFDSRFEDVFKILEFRNTSIFQIEKNIHMLKKQQKDAISIP